MNLKITEYFDEWSYNDRSLHEEFKKENEAIHARFNAVIPSDTLYIRQNELGEGVVYLTLEDSVSVKNFLKHKQTILSLLKGTYIDI